MTIYSSNSSLSPTQNLVVAVSLSTAAALAVVAYNIWQKRPRKPEHLRVEVECACGQVCLTVDAPAPVHLVCYCDDCQNYAKWLQLLQNKSNSSSSPSAVYEGPRCRRVVDGQGGSRTCQVFRRNVHIQRGADLIEFTYLDPTKVPSRPQQMFRGHASCCQTPLCSAFWNELTVMGLYAANFKVTNETNGGKAQFFFLSPNSSTQIWDDDATWMPAPEYRINCKYALMSSTTTSNTPERKSSLPLLPPQGHAEFPAAFLVRFLWRNFVVGPKVVPGDFDIPSSSSSKGVLKPKMRPM